MTSLAEASELPETWAKTSSSREGLLDGATNLSDVAAASLQSMASMVRGFTQWAEARTARKRTRLSPDAQSQSQEPSIARQRQYPSIQAPWLKDWTDVGGYQQVMDREMFFQEDGLFPKDHLFRALMEQGLMHDTRVLFKDSRPPPSGPHSGLPSGTLAPAAEPTQPSGDPDAAAPPHPACGCRVISLNLMGPGVCGHPGIMHGGMTAALIDETCGYLLYILRHRQLLEFQAVVTASLEVQYKQPLVPDQPVCVTAWVSALEGRKIWVKITVADRPAPPEGAPVTPAEDDAPPNRVYATGKALFIVPRPRGSSSALLSQQEAATKQTLGFKRSATQHEGNPSDV